MPDRWTSVLIVCFWLAMHVLLWRQDVLPHLGYGRLTYSQLLTEVAVDTSSFWKIYLDEQAIGHVHTTVRPPRPEIAENSQRALEPPSWSHTNIEIPNKYTIHTQVSLSTKPFTGSASEDLPLLIKGLFVVSPSGELERFYLGMSVENLFSSKKARLESVFGLEGHVEGSELVIVPQNVPLLKEEIRLQFDPHQLLQIPLTPTATIDRMPNLRLGKKWTTPVINPLSMISIPGFWAGFLGAGQEKVMYIHHEVTSTELIDWNEEKHSCYVVEHRSEQNVTGRTWVERQNWRVLRYEMDIPLPTGQKRQLRLELDPKLFEM